VPKNIFLVRHGDYKRTANGDQNQHLEARGEEQARKTGQYLATLGCNFSVIHVSTMIRAMRQGDSTTHFEAYTHKMCEGK
jgi:phosphohistidine phosphatase SixA